MKRAILAVLFYLMRIFPIKQNKIVFCQFQGKGYGDNCKYIAEALLKQVGNYDLVWLVRPNAGDFPEGIRTVPYLSIRSIYEQVTARVWVDNCRKPGYVRKRKGQYYIMTWHGGLALKQIEKDVEAVMPAHYNQAAKSDSQMADLFLSNSRWTTDLYKRAFWYDGEIAEVGLPREDVLFGHSREAEKQIREKLGIPEGTKIVLYAPTFRKNTDADSLNLYRLDWNSILNNFEKCFGDKWIGLIRLHPDIAKFKDFLPKFDRTMDVTAYPDMQELLLAADAVISDYSSSILDFSYTGKPGFLYTPDYEDYMADRNFYFDLRNLPFPIADTESELVKNITGFENGIYVKKLREFHESVGLFPGGNASAYTANRICSIINKNKEE